MGHTKLAPDKLFCGISQTFCKSDVIFIEMLDQIMKQYATSHLFTSGIMLHWKASLQSKYTFICDMHDIIISKKLGNIVVSFSKLCLSGEYTVLKRYRHNLEQSLFVSPYDPVSLSHEKVWQLDEQQRRYIKSDVLHYVPPQFLHLSPEPAVSMSTDHPENKNRKCTYPGCDGSGHVNPGGKDISLPSTVLLQPGNVVFS